MPPRTRKSNGGSRNTPTTGTQQKLSFKNRVTKSVPKALAKDSIASSPLRKELLRDKIDAELAGAENEEIKDVEATPEPEKPVVARKQTPQKSDLELKAETTSDAAINRYWRAVEGEMMSKRVHQEDLSTGEKVLRYFDVCSQYGPCIGIKRMKRWQRAQMLGLNPPVEVLAVLLKEEAQGNKAIERAHMDEIMNANTTGA